MTPTAGADSGLSRSKAQPQTPHTNWGSLAFCFVMLLALGATLGLVSHAIGFSRPHGELFQIFIGVPLALAAAPLIWRGHVSRAWAMACVCVGALAAFAHQHLLEYREFPEKYAARVQLVLEGQALREIVKEFRNLSRAFDDINVSDERLSADERARLSATKTLRDDFDPELLAMSESADAFAAGAGDREVAPLLRRNTPSWDKLRDRIKADGVAEMGLGHAPDEEPSAAEMRGAGEVLRSFRFAEYMSAKADQGAVFRWFGTETRLTRPATIAWWCVEIVLAALVGGLLVRTVPVSRSSSSAAIPKAR